MRFSVFFFFERAKKRRTIAMPCRRISAPGKIRSRVVSRTLSPRAPRLVRLERRDAASPTIAMTIAVTIITLVSRLCRTAIDIDGSKCVERVWLLRPFVACLPAWFRFMQCLRRYRDSREAFPHLANAAKYATTFFVITFSFLNLQHSSKTKVK